MERRWTVEKADSGAQRPLLAFVLGAVAGGVAVAVATRALPRMMAAMMRNMMSQMGEAGCSPAEM